eukprot:300954-Rhodomonas_salina.1
MVRLVECREQPLPAQAHVPCAHVPCAHVPCAHVPCARRHARALSLTAPPPLSLSHCSSSATLRHRNPLSMTH